MCETLVPLRDTDSQVQHVFFAGGFLSHPLARKLIVKNWTLKDRYALAMFGQVGKRRYICLILCTHGLLQVHILERHVYMYCIRSDVAGDWLSHKLQWLYFRNPLVTRISCATVSILAPSARCSTRSYSSRSSKRVPSRNNKMVGTAGEWNARLNCTLDGLQTSTHGELVDYYMYKCALFMLQNLHNI